MATAKPDQAEAAKVDKVEAKEVVATEVGYYGDRLIQPGDEFTVPGNAKASWFKDKSK